MGVVELLDELEGILKTTLPEDKAKQVKKIIAKISEEITKEVIDKESSHLEEKFSQRLATKEDLYKVKEELKEDIFSLKMELEDLKLNVEQRFGKLEKELIVVKILLWIIVILSGLSSFPQILNLFKFLK